MMNERTPAVTAKYLDEWAHRTVRTRLALHFQAASYSHAEREQAFIQLSNLLLESIQLLRQASAALREKSDQPQEQVPGSAPLEEEAGGGEDRPPKLNQTPLPISFSPGELADRRQVRIRSAHSVNPFGWPDESRPG